MLVHVFYDTLFFLAVHWSLDFVMTSRTSMCFHDYSSVISPGKKLVLMSISNTYLESDIPGWLVIVSMPVPQ
jgi:hypothetical protein